ncbi:MAG: 50S ribosomal protein L15 [Sediminibacterium sp.]|nr:50S ribosomal protein L15 [Sediminibacterium sp.]
MKLHQLQPADGSVKKRKRLGRGEASGKGGTSTKGNKGHQSRSGFKNKMAHEGGQMPIQRRIPKRGFTNIFREEFRIFNLGQLQQIITDYELSEITAQSLFDCALIQKNDKIKILAKGNLESKVNFKVNAISKQAKLALDKLGVEVEIVSK